MNKLLLTILFFSSLALTFSQDSWQKVLTNKEGTVLLKYSNADVFISDESGKIQGIEYDIMLKFIDYVNSTYHVNLTLKYEKVNSFNILFTDLTNGQSGTFGAASFSITDNRKQLVNFSPKYMADIETMISSKNLPVFKDTAQFIKYANSSTFLIVPNSTFEEDYQSLSSLNLTTKVEYLKELSTISQKISAGENLISYTELPSYFVSLKNGLKLKRQNLFKFERDGYAIIYPKNSDWQPIVDEFFNSNKSKFIINSILKKHLGNDINDLLLQVSASENGEFLLLTKEKELQEVELELNELTIKNAQLEKKKTEAENKLILAQSQRDKLYLFAGIGFVGLIALFSLIAYRNKSKSNKIITAQKHDVEQKRIEIQTQHDELEYTHKQISDSIKYAERLQMAILPSRQQLDDHIGDEFVVFKPKDVVSGDFYWIEKTKNYKLLAVADCTGHGVPGALVSVVCSSALNRCVNEFHLENPADILNKTTQIVADTFGISGSGIRDGMDICLCAIQNGHLIFAGAYNPLWIIRHLQFVTESQKNKRGTIIDGDFALIEFKADKQPIGLYEDATPFKETKIELFKNDKLFLSTDGFQDQFGGPKNKKFKSKPFKKLLLSTSNLSMIEQHQILNTTFDNWRGSIEQIDDVCIIGLRL